MEINSGKGYNSSVDNCRYTEQRLLHLLSAVIGIIILLDFESKQTFIHLLYNLTNFVYKIHHT